MTERLTGLLVTLLGIGLTAAPFFMMDWHDPIPMERGICSGITMGIGICLCVIGIASITDD